MDLETKQTMSPLKVLVAIVVILLVFLFVVYVFQICWNITMPSIFGITSISLIQSLALIVGATILFGGLRGCTYIVKS